MARAVTSLGGAARYRKWWVPYLWCVPPVAAVVAFSVYPFFNTVLLSFTDARPLGGAGGFVGLQNYQDLLRDEEFWSALLNSVVYALCVVPVLTVLPLLLALLVRDRLPGIGIFRSLFYLPAVASVVVVALAWSYLLKDDGLINALLKDTGLVQSSLPFLTGRWWVLISAMLITIWKGLPYYMILYLSALANVDRSLYEAAEMDGAGSVRKFFHITLPGVRLMMNLVAVLVMIGSMKVFSEVFLLTNGTGGIGGESSTLTMYIRDIGIADSTYGSLGLGGAASVVLFVLTVGLVLLSQRLNRKSEEQ
ncbi:carbohydrate ABC transporter permease [Actinoplanes sp. DH11]|uniref:carbohydrate ABC transporter permease n=1 Tax=Actinoplanes sp. DH11 TaxID=2857011 RepID=UPI001E30B2A6|nr:sugar ABC transporter permease [Actinoplanes sp. DH11]